jgi:sialate O-acetylesterase
MKTPSLPKAIAMVLAPAFLAAPLHANVKLPALISDNMVLQQDLPDNVWGWADPGEKVTVKFADKSAEAVADAEGKWNAKLDGLAAGAVGDLTVTGNNSLTVKNVAVGEVWVASGQSNMEFTLGGAKNAPEEIKAAKYPLLRMFTVQKTAKAEPQADCVGKWEVCTPETAPHFSAVGYFFSRRLLESLKQPIGLIHTSWGGTPAEFWTPKPVLEADPAYKPIFLNWQHTVEVYPQAKEKYDKDIIAWHEEQKKALDAGTKPPPAPRAPRGGDDFGSPGCLFNGMIEPVLHYTIRGAIWYQGEANVGNPALYKRLFPTMIQSWRRAWNEEDFPFLFVQLANYLARHDEPTDSNWAALREAQTMTLELPHTGMAVTIDIGEGENIHPKDKQDVGLRLALAAEATVYYHDQEFSGPIYSGMQIEDDRLRLTFRHGEGMKAADGAKLKGFAIAGADKKFVWADAEVQGDHVIVSSPAVKEPVAARYAWADNPECNLINAAGLPASPFRTDDWRQTFAAAKPATTPAAPAAPAAAK